MTSSWPLGTTVMVSGCLLTGSFRSKPSGTPSDYEGPRVGLGGRPQITVKIPYALSSAHLHVERIPNTRGAMTATTPVCDGNQTVQGGTVSLSVPSLVDGDAYTVTVSPATGSGQC